MAEDYRTYPDRIIRGFGSAQNKPDISRSTPFLITSGRAVMEPDVPYPHELIDTRTGNRLVVTGLGAPPTTEEAREILDDVFGTGRLTKLDVPSVTAGAGSIGTAMALGTALKRIPPIALASAAAGGVGEVIKQIQTPSRVGKWNISSIQEPALMGMTTRTYDPQSLWDRAKMVAFRAAEEGGLDVAGALAMQVPRVFSRLLQRMSMGSEVLPSLEAKSGGQIIEQSLREGIAPRALGHGGREWLPYDRLYGGKPHGKGARLIKESADKVDQLIRDVGGENVPLVDVSQAGRRSFFSDVIQAPSPTRDKSLGEYLQILNDYDLRKPRSDFSALNLGDEMGSLFDRYITNPRAQRVRSAAEEFRSPVGGPLRAPASPYPPDAWGSSPLASAPGTPAGGTRGVGMPSDMYRARVSPEGQLGGEARIGRLPGDVSPSMSMEPGDVSPSMSMEMEQGWREARPVSRPGPGVRQSGYDWGAPGGGYRPGTVGGPFSDLEAVDVAGATAILPRSKGLTSAGDISLSQAISDKRFLEQSVLGPLYAQLKETGTAAGSSRPLLIAKAIHDALSKRIRQTLELGEKTGQMRRGISAIYRDQNQRTRQLNDFLEMIKESPHIAPSPFSLISPAQSLAARTTENLSRYLYAAPQNLTRAAWVAQP